jgi:putative ABC transport system permease protein
LKELTRGAARIITATDFRHMQSFGDILGQVFRAIAANKLRTFLTMFGIAWGVGSLLVLVGLGEGFRSGQHKSMSKMGNDIIMMFNGTIPAVANQHTGMRPYQLTKGDEEALKKLPELRAVTVELQRGDLYQVSPYNNGSNRIVGVESNYSTVKYLPIVQGRFLTDGDVTERRHVAVIGYKAARLLFPGRPLLGETVTINGTAFTIIGAADKVSRGDWDGPDQKLYIPVTTMLELYPVKGENIATDALTSIQFQPTVRGESTAALVAADRVIAARHGFDPSLRDAFQQFDSIQEERMVSAIFDAMDVFLGGVGIVTLGLGAVGIVNIMLVSVTERTREIGLLKAIGATKRSIVAQFFWEGLLLTGISGLIGIGISAGFMWVLQQFLTNKMPGFDPPRLVPWSAALAITSLVISGVVAGLYPATKAAELDPIEALRRE